MTFSDVITLLMTFFILLLTFATNQPETFDRMQNSMFGGGGSLGFAGSMEGMDKDSLLLRERARTGRQAQQGSTMPPLYSDPSLSSLDKGIAGLASEEERILDRAYRLRMKLNALVDQDGMPTENAKGQIGMLARQIKNRQMGIEFFLHDDKASNRTLGLISLLAVSYTHLTLPTTPYV